MLQRLVEGSLKNRLVVSVLFLVATLLGVRALLTLPVDAFPDTTPIQVQINTVAPALNPEETGTTSIARMTRLAARHQMKCTSRVRQPTNNAVSNHDGAGHVEPRVQSRKLASRESLAIQPFSRSTVMRGVAICRSYVLTEWHERCRDTRAEAEVPKGVSDPRLRQTLPVVAIV